jgi:RNA polymerase sigma-32 factor
MGLARQARRPERPGEKGIKTMAASALAVMSPDGGLSRYLSEIRKFPMLAKDEEFMLAKRWQEHEDPDAAHRLVTSHLRLVAKIAMGYRGYGLPIGEVISEGNVGLMQAVKKFDPDRGFRLATYAMWWIRASIQEYILRSWSLVKMGTTAAQKKLFFNLRKAKSEISALQEGDLHPDQVTTIATKLGVLNEEVISMNRRLSGGDASLNSPMRADSESEWQDWLVDDVTPSQETVVADTQEKSLRMGLLEEAMTELTDRERHILTERRLKDEPTTLEELASQYGVSRERVRQIEVRAFEKLQKSMKAAAEERHLVDA